MKVLTLQNITEAELIEGCVNGRRDCQRLLYEKYSSKMFGLCLRYAPDYHTAEDILQEAFVKVFFNIFKYNGSGSFEGWMKRVFINYAIESLRRTDKNIVSDDLAVATELTTANDVLAKLKMEDLLKLVQSLPNGYRTVFNLYVIEGFPHKEIADMLNITEGTSKSQLARAKAMLQKMVQENY